MIHRQRFLILAVNIDPQVAPVIHKDLPTVVYILAFHRRSRQQSGLLILRKLDFGDFDTV